MIASLATPQNWRKRKPGTSTSLRPSKMWWRNLEEMWQRNGKKDDDDDMMIMLSCHSKTLQRIRLWCLSEAKCGEGIWNAISKRQGNQRGLWWWWRWRHTNGRVNKTCSGLDHDGCLFLRQTVVEQQQQQQQRCIFSLLLTAKVFCLFPPSSFLVRLLFLRILQQCLCASFTPSCRFYTTSKSG